MSDNTIEKHDAEANERAKLNEEAEAAMSNSKPTPTQREADLIRRGLLHPDDKENPEQPTMPSVEEQRRRLADAGATQPYRTRDMGAAQQAGRPAAAQPQTQTAHAASGGHQAAAPRQGAASAKDEDKK